MNVQKFLSLCLKCSVKTKMLPIETIFVQFDYLCAKICKRFFLFFKLITTPDTKGSCKSKICPKNLRILKNMKIVTFSTQFYNFGKKRLKRFATNFAVNYFHFGAFFLFTPILDIKHVCKKNSKKLSICKNKIKTLFEIIVHITNIVTNTKI